MLFIVPAVARKLESGVIIALGAKLKDASVVLVYLAFSALLDFQYWKSKVQKRQSVPLLGVILQLESLAPIANYSLGSEVINQNNAPSSF